MQFSNRTREIVSFNIKSVIESSAISDRMSLQICDEKSQLIFFDHYAVELDLKNILDRFVDNDVFQRFSFSRNVIINRRLLEIRQMMNFTSIIVRFKNELERRRDEKLENFVYLWDFILFDLIIYIIRNYVRDFINENEIFTQNQLRRIDVLDFCITLNYAKNNSHVC
jgi:hypothetical protein